MLECMQALHITSESCMLILMQSVVLTGSSDIITAQFASHRDSGRTPSSFGTMPGYCGMGKAHEVLQVHGLVEQARSWCSKPLDTSTPPWIMMLNPRQLLGISIDLKKEKKSKGPLSMKAS